MLFKTHLAFSLLVYLVFLKFVSLDFSSKVIFGISLFIATIFVDIDSKRSRIGNFWFFRPLQWFVSHRGMIHSPLFAFFVSILVGILDSNAGIGFFFGYFSHLFLDFLTKEGIFLFWPFFNKKFSLIGFRTGRLFEEIIFVITFLGDIYMIIITFM